MLNACGFNLPVLKLIHDYLPQRKQRMRIRSFYSDNSIWRWHLELLRKSILGSLLFNFFLADFVLSQETKTASYANHDTPYVSAENIDKLISSLEEESKTLFKRLADNRLKANSDECHLPVSGTQKANVKIEHFCIDNSERDKS